MKITEYLIAQHRVFLELLSSLEELKTSHKLENALGLKELIFAIVTVVEKHADIEEKFLFPELKPYLGEQMSPIAVMELEHAEIRKIISTLKESMDPHVVRVEAAKFIIFLRDHIAKEEMVLFPLTEDMIDEKRLEAIAKTVINLEKAKTEAT